VVRRVDRKRHALIGHTMSGYPTRTVTAWIAMLAIAWLLLCSPWSTGWNVAVGMLVTLAAALLVVAATKRMIACREATQQVLRKIDGVLGSLPADITKAAARC
jgi:hypothetical protein